MYHCDRHGERSTISDDRVNQCSHCGGGESVAGGAVKAWAGKSRTKGFDLRCKKGGANTFSTKKLHDLYK